MAFRFDLNKYQSLYTPLAIFAGCLLIAVVIYISGGITITIGGGQKVAGEANLDSFAKCLTEKGATLYAASTCGYCAQQKELFGDSVQYIDQIECYDEASGGWSKVCQDAGIEGVPTWIFKDGSTATGVQTLKALSEKTGCSLQ